MTVMHSLAWTVNPYSYKPRGRPMVSPILRFQRIESMLMDNGRHSENYRRCSGCGRRCGRARRCIGCTRLTITFEEELARARQTMVEQNRLQAMEEGTIGALATGAAEGDETQTAQPVAADNSQSGNRFRWGSLNWGVWGCFIFATILLVPSHIYLKRYDYRGEFLGIFFVLTLFILCFSVSMFHSKTREMLLHRLQLEEEMRNFPAISSPASRRRRYRRNIRFSSRYNHYPLRRVRSTPELQANGQSPTVSGTLVQDNQFMEATSSGVGGLRPSAYTTHDSSLDPPPYHLAVLLPSPTSDCFVRRCETPPPSYEHIQ